MKLKLRKVKRTLYSLFINNFLLKLLSLATAILLWFGVSSTVKTKYQFYSYVDVINIPEDFEVVKVKPEKVKVIVEGRRRFFGRPTFDKVFVYVDGKRLKEGKNELKVNLMLEGFDKDDVVVVEPESVIIFARKLRKEEVY